MAGTNTTELAHKLAKLYPELTNKQAEAILKTTSELLLKSICDLEPDSRDRVSIRGLGNFGVKKTAARTVKNIKTGTAQTVAAGLRITFKAASEAKDAVAAGTYEVSAHDTASRKPSTTSAASINETPVKASVDLEDVDL